MYIHPEALKSLSILGNLQLQRLLNGDVQYVSDIKSVLPVTREKGIYWEQRTLLNRFFWFPDFPDFHLIDITPSSILKYLIK